MRSLLCVLLFLGGFAARAQNPPSPFLSPTPANTPVPTPAKLIPDDVLPASPQATAPAAPTSQVPSVPELDQILATNPLNSAAEEYRRRIEWRKLRNLVENDAEVKTALAEVSRARTDLEKRKRLQRYYELHSAQMLAKTSDPAMQAYLNARKTEKLNSLKQPRVRPEPALSPSPTPTPAQVAAPPPEPALPTAEASVAPLPSPVP